MDLASAIAAIDQHIIEFTAAKKVLLSMQSETNMKIDTPLPPSPNAPLRIKRSPGMKEKKQYQISFSRQAVSDYITQHPACTKKEAAEALKMTPNAVGFHLTKLKQDGRMESIGKGYKSRWRSISKSSSQDQSSQAEVSDVLKCKMCNAICSSQTRLESHMRVVHHVNV